MAENNHRAERPVLIRAAALRERWGGMSNTAFYEKLKKGLIPPPHYPFGDSTPYWSMASIEEFERQAAEKSRPGGKAQPSTVARPAGAGTSPPKPRVRTGD